MTAWFKVINPDGTTPQGYGRWPLPVKSPDGTWTPGEWVSVKRPVERPLAPADLCTSRVLHILRADQISLWLGPVIAEVEVDGEVVEDDDKCGTRRARLTRIIETWNDRSARHFAADCAEDVLRLVPEPERAICAATIAVVRRYADGEATGEELDAAWAAAWDAAWDAARAAAGAAAGDAAWAAAWDAAWDAARAAAWDAARAAAWDAARAAAGAAAGAAARDAARAAAGDAARAAAGDAARAAARAAQTARLVAMLGIES